MGTVRGGFNQPEAYGTFTSGMSGRLSVEMSLMRMSAEIVQDVREKRCYSFCYDTELTSNAETDKDKTYLLPDRIIITVSAERFHCAEVLYQPIFVDKEACGIHDTSFQTIMKCDVDIRKESYANVVLSSCTTCSKFFL